MGTYNRVNTIREEDMCRLKLFKPGSSRTSLVVRWEFVKAMNGIDVVQALLNSEVAPIEGR